MVIMSKNIDYKLLSDVLTFYKTKGFKYMEVPWLVNPLSNQMTLPTGKDIGQLVDGRTLVGSAEQGFIDLILSGKSLPKKQRLMSISPCFRLRDNADELHQETFMKLELAFICNNYNHAKSMMNEFLNIASSLFGQLLNEKIDRLPVDIDQTDLMINVGNDFEWIELGSYGIRKIDNEYLVYGTGIALPRFSLVADKLEKTYHSSLIVKHEPGSIYKIKEEVDELLDAAEQNDKILQLCELADLVLAIKLYSENQLNTSLNDLLKFGLKTESAFRNGKR